MLFIIAIKFYFSWHNQTFFYFCLKLSNLDVSQFFSLLSFLLRFPSKRMLMYLLSALFVISVRYITITITVMVFIIVAFYAQKNSMSSNIVSRY